MHKNPQTTRGGEIPRHVTLNTDNRKENRCNAHARFILVLKPYSSHEISRSFSLIIRRTSIKCTLNGVKMILHFHDSMI